MSGDGVGRGALMAGFARAAGLALPYAAVVVSRALDCLYILQLERYKPDRFRAWVVSHRRTLVPGRECALQALTVATVAALAITGWHWLGLAIVWLLTGHIILSRHRSLQVSQRLQWTARAARVAVLALGIGGFLVAWAADTAGHVLPASQMASRYLAGGIAGLAFVGLLAPTVVGVAARVMAPLERAIARRFLVEASRRMRTYRGRVLGITGSYGKTSTKYVVADLLSAEYRVLKTPAGVNSTMGITRVIREELKDEHEVFVVEMSAYGPGEIREVCDIVHPSLGILTAVGVQHLERFGTPERIAEAKYELLGALPAGAPAVINADDPVCLRLAERARTEGKRVLLYGMGVGAANLAVLGTEVAVTARGSRFRVVTADGQTEVFDTKLLGRWNLSNVLGGIAAALEWGVPLSVMKPAVAALVPAPRRLEIHEEGGVIRILDVANANPRGAEMALEVLAQFAGGSRILITPGMVELGPIEAEENRRFGEKAASVCDYVILVGPDQTRPIRQGLMERGFPADKVLTARQAHEVTDLLAGIVRPGDILLYENRLPDTYLEVAS
jgi:UDP-N-acetylmuramoyl-tripeptide--D-alanyl-D-alanine ligase